MYTVHDLIDLRDVSAKRGGESKSKIYKDVKDGLLPPPVKLGSSSAWPAREIDMINGAVIAGKSDDEIRQLVRELIASRTAASSTLDQMRQPPASKARRGDAVNAPAQQKKHAAGTHPTTIAQRESTRRKATIRGQVL